MLLFESFLKKMKLKKGESVEIEPRNYTASILFGTVIIWFLFSIYSMIEIVLIINTDKTMSFNTIFATIASTTLIYFTISLLVSAIMFLISRLIINVSKIDGIGLQWITSAIVGFGVGLLLMNLTSNFYYAIILTLGSAWMASFFSITTKALVKEDGE